MTVAPDFVLPGGHELRALEEADADELHALIERNRGELANWMQWAQGETPEDTLRFVRTARTMERDGGGLRRAIVGEHIVGVVSCSRIDRTNRSAEIGYWLDRGQRGRGIMTSAVATLIDHAFDSLHLNRLEIRTDVNNGPSRALAERLGFRYEGTLRQSYRVSEERYSDDAVYSLLASDPAHTEDRASDAQRIDPAQT